MRITIYIATIITCACLSCEMLFASQEDNTRVVLAMTSTKPVASRLTSKNGDVVDVFGEAIFKLTGVAYDDTVTGLFTYTISAEMRQRIAESVGRNLPEVPLEIKLSNVIGLPKKHTACPDFHFVFASRNYPAETTIGEFKLRFEEFTLSATEKKQQIYVPLCKWLKWLDSGRVRTRGVINEINRVIKSEH